MPRLFTVTGLAVTACMFCTSAFADGHAISTRQGLMKNVGAAMKASAQMVKGEVEYNAATAELAMRTINSSAIGFGHYFPEDSKTGGKTEAAPAIWTDMAGFKAVGAKLAETSLAAANAAKDGKDAFTKAFGPVGANCKACHEKYRIKKN